MTNDELNLWTTLLRLNRTWTQGNPAGLAEFFHPDMVAIVPSTEEIIVGRDNCIAGWTWFVENARILSWEEFEPVIHIHDDTGVVGYYYEMHCVINGEDLVLKGRDLFTFVREQGRWIAVSDQFSPMP